MIADASKPRACAALSVETDVYEGLLLIRVVYALSPERQENTRNILINKVFYNIFAYLGRFV